MSRISIDLELNLPDLGAAALRDTMTFRVFDQHMKYRGKIQPDYGSIELLPGIYKISGDLPNGEEWEKVVILGTEPLEVTVDYDADVKNVNELDVRRSASEITGFDDSDFEDVERALGRVALSKTRRPAFMVDSDRVPMSYNQETLIEMLGRQTARNPVTLVSSDGFEVTERGAGHWEFQPTKRDKIGFAEFIAADGTKIKVHLPASRDARPLGCSVFIRPKTQGQRMDVRVGIAEDRAVVNAMLTLLDVGKTTQAAELAKNARDLLFAKYSEPIGATLGAVILYQLGQIEEEPFQSWSKNLFRNFRWISDVVILNVAVNVGRGVFMSNDFDQLLDCVGKPVVFTSIYSLLVQYIRSWDGILSPSQEECRRKALKALALINAQIDWSAPTVVLQDTRNGDR